MLFVGRPPWLTDEQLAALQDEAQGQGATAEMIRVQHFGDLGSVEDDLKTDPKFLGWMSDLVGGARLW